MVYQLFLYDPQIGLQFICNLTGTSEETSREEAEKFLKTQEGKALSRGYTNVTFKPWSSSPRTKSTTFKIRANPKHRQTAWFEIRKDGKEL